MTVWYNVIVMETNVEYGKMAKLYDVFYERKDYRKEVEFIKSFIDEGVSILDAGCGTGGHAKIFQDSGFDVFGFDLSEDMVKVASQKLGKSFDVGNILTYKSNKKFDVVISFFAVFNHLKSYKQFEIALKNLLLNLKQGGVLIIDLHNPQKNGKKFDGVGNIRREMRWNINKLLGIEKTRITYKVDGNCYKTRRQFKIFKPRRLSAMCQKLNLKFQLFENYNKDSVAGDNSKNLQLVVMKG